MTVTDQTRGAWHGDPDLKARTLAAAIRHREQDQYVRGMYFELDAWSADGWRGCAVGCTAITVFAEQEGITEREWVRQNLDVFSLHRSLAVALGVPEWLWHLADRIFESAPDYETWTERFIAAIPVGADLDTALQPILRDLVMDPDQGAVANAATALARAGLADQAATLRALPREAAWGDIKAACADVAVAAFAFSDAAYAAAHAAARASVGADAAYAAYAAASSDAAWSWVVERVLRRITLADQVTV